MSRFFFKNSAAGFLWMVKRSFKVLNSSVVFSNVPFCEYEKYFQMIGSFKRYLVMASYLIASLSILPMTRVISGYSGPLIINNKILGFDKR